MTATALGIDIGGTKIRAALVTEAGDVLAVVESPTPARCGPDRVLADAVCVARKAAAGRDISAVGVGAAGVIDPQTGRVTSATDTIDRWAGADIAQAMRKAFGVPVAVCNDAHAHGAGEAAFGAGAGHRTVLLVAAGTGVGGAILVDGLPLIGAHGAAGHLGHIPSADAADLICSCGIVGHLEAVSSGPGLVRLYRALGGAPHMDAVEVLRRAPDDPAAQAALSRAARALGVAIGGLVSTIDPGVVVIAGGLSRSGENWWRALISAVRSTALPVLADVPILPASLGPDAASIGAAIIALKTRQATC